MPPPVPPTRKTYGVPDYVWRALALLLTGATSYLAARAQFERPETPPRVTAQPEGKAMVAAPSSDPTTDTARIEVRRVAADADRVAREHQARIAVLEARACLLERELRDAVARRVELAAGKRGGPAREKFEQRTTSWAACSQQLEQVQQRGSLREASDSALR